MANVTGIDPGFKVASIKEAKRTTKKKISKHAATCGCCGYEFEGSRYQTARRFWIDEDDYVSKICFACTNFFGLNGFGQGYTDMGPDSAKQRLKDLEEKGYAVMLKTQNFAGVHTGINFTVDFGDVFKVKRIGTHASPDGSKEDVFKRFTIDIQVGLEVLTLYPHEVGSMTWTELMLSRRDGEYEEAYVCAEDSEGYFRPSPEIREQLNNIFGAR